MPAMSARNNGHGRAICSAHRQKQSIAIDSAMRSVMKIARNFFGANPIAASVMKTIIDAPPMTVIFQRFPGKSSMPRALPIKL